MTPALRDRIMSLHRHAYACADYPAWVEKARRLECPEEAVDQFWRTATAARDAGLAAERAFPLSGEITKHLDATCLPGDLVWWRTLSGDVREGELAAWDNGTALVNSRGRQEAVRAA